MFHDVHCSWILIVVVVFGVVGGVECGFHGGVCEIIRLEQHLPTENRSLLIQTEQVNVKLLQEVRIVQDIILLLVHYFDVLQVNFGLRGVFADIHISFDILTEVPLLHEPPKVRVPTPLTLPLNVSRHVRIAAALLILIHEKLTDKVVYVARFGQSTALQKVVTAAVFASAFGSLRG